MQAAQDSQAPRLMRPARQLAQEAYLSRLRTNRRARRRDLYEANKRPADGGCAVMQGIAKGRRAQRRATDDTRSPPIAAHSLRLASSDQARSCNRRLCRATLALQPCQSAAEQSNRRSTLQHGSHHGHRAAALRPRGELHGAATAARRPGLPAPATERPDEVRGGRRHRRERATHHHLRLLQGGLPHRQGHSRQGRGLQGPVRGLRQRLVPGDGPGQHFI